MYKPGADDADDDTCRAASDCPAGRSACAALPAAAHRRATSSGPPARVSPRRWLPVATAGSAASVTHRRSADPGRDCATAGCTGGGSGEARRPSPPSRSPCRGLLANPTGLPGPGASGPLRRWNKGKGCV